MVPLWPVSLVGSSDERSMNPSLQVTQLIQLIPLIRFFCAFLRSRKNKR